jgi:hypothetical protein
VSLTLTAVLAIDEPSYLMWRFDCRRGTGLVNFTIDVQLVEVYKTDDTGVRSSDTDLTALDSGGMSAGTRAAAVKDTDGGIRWLGGVQATSSGFQGESEAQSAGFTVAVLI